MNERVEDCLTVTLEEAERTIHEAEQALAQCQAMHARLLAEYDVEKLLNPEQIAEACAQAEIQFRQDMADIDRMVKERMAARCRFAASPASRPGRPMV